MILLTAAFPFVPAELNVAHFASTYVPADISRRLLSALGEDVLLVSATDYHSIYASRDGKSPDAALCERYHRAYLALFQRMGICFDCYFTTEDPAHKERVQDTFLHLQKEGLIVRASAADQVCSGCGCFLPRRFSEENGEQRCRFCGGKCIETREMPHYFLKLSGTEAQLRDFAATLRQRDVRNAVLRYASDGLSDWDITRYNTLGVPVPSDEEQSFYIWFDSLVGYRSLCADCGEPPRQTVHFIGKNIVYYHSAVWQLLARRLFGPETDVQLSARGFLNLQQTDGSLLNLEALTARCSPDVVRFYLAFKVKDNVRDYAFSEQDLRNVADHYCCRQLGGFFYRAWQLLRVQESASADAPASGHGDSEAFLRDFVALAQQCSVHEILRLILSRVETLTGRFLSRGPRVRLDPSDTDALLYDAAVLACLLSAYMPELAKAYTIYDQWVPQTLAEAGEYRSHVLKEQKEVVKVHGLFQ